MLAEIFMLRFEAQARTPQQTTSSSSSPFVAFSPDAPRKGEQGATGKASNEPNRYSFFLPDPAFGGCRGRANQLLGT